MPLFRILSIEEKRFPRLVEFRVDSDKPTVDEFTDILNSILLYPKMIESTQIGDMYFVDTRRCKNDPRTFFLYCSARLVSPSCPTGDENVGINMWLSKNLGMQVYGNAVIICWKMKSVSNGYMFMVDRIVQFHLQQHLSKLKHVYVKRETKISDENDPVYFPHKK